MRDRVHLHRWLASLAGVLGVLAVAAGEPHPEDATRKHDVRARYVGVLGIARWLRDGNASIHLVDVRADSLFGRYHIPGAERVSLSALRDREWGRDRTVVIYADDARHAEEASRLLRAAGVERAHVLRGGLLSWIDSMAEPQLATLPATATPDEQAARREHLELSRYFGGMPIVAPAASRPSPEPAAPLPSRPSRKAAVERVVRRGC